MLCRRRSGLVRKKLAVRDCRVAAIDRQSDGKRGLEGRLVEARERAPGVSRFELRDRVRAITAFAQVEAAQLVVEYAGIPDVDVRRPRWNRFGDRQGGG